MLFSNCVSETYCKLSVPRISNPALQKAEIEWKKANQTPFTPKFLQNAGIIITAPHNSKIRVAFKINPVRRTIPPTFGAAIASCIVHLCIREIFRPERRAKDAATVTTPRPPIWIRSRIIAWPKIDQ